MNKKELKRENIRLGTHGEDYGSWMSNPVFYIIRMSSSLIPRKKPSAPTAEQL